jgi:hypothetical protein
VFGLHLLSLKCQEDIHEEIWNWKPKSHGPEEEAEALDR